MLKKSRLNLDGDEVDTVCNLILPDEANIANKFINLNSDLLFG